MINRDEYIVDGLSKIKHKRWELYVISRIMNQLDSDIGFSFQQLVKTKQGKYFYADLWFSNLNMYLEVNEDPEIQIDNSFIFESVKKFQINKNELNILLGIGGSGSTKRIPAKTFLNVMGRISEIKRCKFFLATGKILKNNQY